MPDAIVSGYRDTYPDSYASQRKTGKASGQNLDMIFTDQAEQSLNTEDFLNLLIMQIQNQDFTNPMDDSQMMTQMAQISTMQQMQELAAYSKSNYAASLLGKTVTAAKFSVSGDVLKETGPVQKISLINNEYMLYVNDQKFTLEQMMELHSGAASELPFDAASLKPVQQSVAARWAEVSWPVPTEDGELAADLDYSVYYSAENNLSSVEDILKNGTLAVHSGGMNSTIITGLEPDTAYCVNIIAEDKAGNKTCYQPLTLRTKAEDSWQREGE